MNSKAIAFHYAETINVKSYKEASTYKLLFYDGTESFVSSKQGTYTYVFKYGVIAFYNQDIKEIEILKKGLKNHCVRLHSVSSQLTEEHKSSKLELIIIILIAIEVIDSLVLKFIN